ncbi:FAD-dependent oxidoreductase [Candidatus Ruthia endofausta]|uniref:FAD-dependent oxidoreductase n=1 Tax=Candidatus Ruthia endofausta TaxID=2738852 RepID=A0A6N0HNR4_9GAMM|nr:NAD(P)/FAD-dependent oxidoreductase [Candidatus Ruthia endofausta]QKQ23950.1 FAD-dependent oxidoreductase [Candidatus Ruthia endofausta]
MSNKHNRRNFLKIVGASGVATTAALYTPFAIGGASKKVVIIGGGMGGATAAKYMRMMDKSIKVTLITANKNYYTGFASNEVVSGERHMTSITFSYSGLRKHGVQVVVDTATSIDENKRGVRTVNGKKFAYDRLIVSPGIDFRWEAIDGYNAQMANTRIPHAWIAGSQTEMLHNQLHSMRDGGTVIIAAPPNPFRCPPGPYERAAQIAHYLKHNKPKSKILILDSKDKFSKFGLFTGGWKRHYGYGTDNSIIEWIPAYKGGAVEAVDVANMSVSGEFDEFKGDVINIIPAQKAGKIAFTAGLTNSSGWCPVQGNTFESTIHKNIHVIGDASIASPMPKSGYAANSEAKICAAAIVALLSGNKIPDSSYVNTCYSVIAPGDGISVAMVYKYQNGKIVKVKDSDDLIPVEFNLKLREREVEYGHTWFNNITNDAFS